MKLLIGIAVVAAAVAATVSASTPVQVKLKVPAANMKATALGLRDGFDQQYRQAGAPLPIYSLMYKAVAYPDDIASQKQVATRPDGTPRVLQFTEAGKRIVSDGNAVKEATFSVLLNGSTGKLIVDVPAHLEATVATTSDAAGRPISLGFRLFAPLHLKPRDIHLPLPVPPDVYLRAVTIEPARLTYELADAPESASKVYLLNMEFDLPVGGGED